VKGNEFMIERLREMIEDPEKRMNLASTTQHKKWQFTTYFEFE
jgi:hypothetical protein